MNNADIHSYTEQWQYQPWVGTHKKHPPEGSTSKLTYDENDLPTQEIWIRSTENNKFAVGVKQFTFEELVEATRTGHTLKRIGPDTNGTRYLIIDLDNDKEECITEAELDTFCSTPDMTWTKGGSGREYRYHLFVFLDHSITQKEDFRRESNIIRTRLEQHIGRSIYLDEHQCNYLQVCYGVPQPLMVREELPGTQGWFRQIRKNRNYSFDAVDPDVKDTEKDTDESITQDQPQSQPIPRRKLVPWNSSLLLNQLKDGSLQARRLPDGSYVNGPARLLGKRFDCIEPKVYGKNVPVGKRHLTAQAWIYKLVPNYYRCLAQGLDYTKDDLVHTFRYLCKRNFQDFETWWLEDGKNLCNSLVQECARWDDYAYDQIQDAYSPSHKRDIYKQRGYAHAATCDICSRCGTLASDNNIVFPCKSVLNSALEAAHLPYSTFRVYVKRLGYSTCYEQDARKSNKYDYILDSATITGGVFYYTQQRNAIKCYCADHEIKYISMASVISTPRKKYKAIITEATDAVKSMIAASDLWAAKSRHAEDTNSVADSAELDNDIPVIFINDEKMGSQNSNQETPSLSFPSLITCLEIEDPNSAESKND